MRVHAESVRDLRVHNGEASARRVRGGVQEGKVLVTSEKKKKKKKSKGVGPLSWKTACRRGIGHKFFHSLAPAAARGRRVQTANRCIKTFAQNIACAAAVRAAVGEHRTALERLLRAANSAILFISCQSYVVSGCHIFYYRGGEKGE